MDFNMTSIEGHLGHVLSSNMFANKTNIKPEGDSAIGIQWQQYVNSFKIHKYTFIS